MVAILLRGPLLRPAFLDSLTGVDLVLENALRVWIGAGLLNV